MTPKRTTIAGSHTWECKARFRRHAGVKARIRAMVAAEGAGERFVTKVLGRELGL